MSATLTSPRSRLYRASVWHPTAVPLEEWKYRNLRRVWLPIYDAIAIFAGVQAVLFGSNMLNRLFPPDLVDILGMALTLSAVACLVGVSFPRLWIVELVGKLLLVGLVASYVATIVLLAKPPGPSLFVAGMLTFGLPMAMFQLSLLGEGIKERRPAWNQGS